MKKEFPQNLGGSDTCYFCRRRVYVMERLSAEGKFFHRSCFKCEFCATTLRLSAYAYALEDGEPPAPGRPVLRAASPALPLPCFCPRRFLGRVRPPRRQPTPRRCPVVAQVRTARPDRPPHGEGTRAHGSALAYVTLLVSRSATDPPPGSQTFAS